MTKFSEGHHAAMKPSLPTLRHQQAQVEALLDESFYRHMSVMPKFACGSCTEKP